MVEMEVGQADMQRTAITVEEPLPQLANPRACVEDQSGVVGELDLYAGGVAAVADGRRPRCGERSPRSPDADDHGAAGSSQKTDITPTASSGCERSGNAVTVISRSRPSRPRNANEPWTGRRSSSAIPEGVCSAVSGCSSKVRGSKSSCQRVAGNFPTSRYERPISSAAASLK